MSGVKGVYLSIKSCVVCGQKFASTTERTCSTSCEEATSPTAKGRYSTESARVHIHNLVDDAIANPRPRISSALAETRVEVLRLLAAGRRRNGG